MRRPRAGPSTARGQRRLRPGKRKALNAFRIDKEDIPRETADVDDLMDQSDEEGVKSEDDEEIDSDEAFGESDDEKYSDFKFLGSSTRGMKGKGKAKETELDEEAEDEEEEEEDGEDYVDLSEMLSTGQSANGTSRKTLRQNDQSDEPEVDSEEESDDEAFLEESESEEGEDADQLDKLGAFVDTLSSKIKEKESQADKSIEMPKPASDESGELAMSDILASLTDPSLQSFRKSLAAQQKNKKSAAQKLDVPLAKPIKERLERQAAYEETKNEISKWQPIVKANREADHLHFPINEPPKQSKQTSASLAGTFEPTTSLEKRVDELLRQSGIRSEKEITSFEDLALKKVSIDEVRQRQAQLRAMRELMFRQEQKAKRIAKIKSKSYRKVLKRERERRLLINGEDEEDEHERVLKAEAARAKERMTLRHKNTGEWAKKVLARGQHDFETRQAVSEQIRRGDDLRKKILGDDESEDESDSAEELEELVRDPNKWGEEEVVEEQPEIRKGVMGMKFMRDAEERQRRENAQQVAEMRAILEAGSDEDEVSETTRPILQNVNFGRKTFTPGDETEKSKEAGNAYEEQEDEDEERIELRIVQNPFHMNKTSKKGPDQKSTMTATSRMANDDQAEGDSTTKSNNSWLSSTSPNQGSEPRTNGTSENPWLSAASSKSSKRKSDNRINKIQNKRKREEENADADVHIDVSVEAINQKLAAAAEEDDDEDAPSMTYGRGRIALQQAELVSRAFAGDGFEEDFAAEKAEAIAEDAPKEEDLTMPGWGSWTGQGVKRRAMEKKLIKKVPGIEESQRKDAKLKNVIINEKRAKSTTKYLASEVPYPFETKEQYERSLSMPVGPEWTTRNMYQKMTEPRVTIRAGAVVNPLQAPFK